MNSKSDIICVTNRHLCHGDYRDALVRIAKAHPHAVILREKDMSEDEYRELAAWYLDICREEGTKLYLHYFYEVARELKPDGLHMPLSSLEELVGDNAEYQDVSEQREGTTQLENVKLGTMQFGVSCHSVEDVIRAEALGCSYIVAGHIFDTDCKKGLPGRGLEFLKSVTGQSTFPVYAIGGITPENIDEIRKYSAAGACIMSSAMESENVEELLDRFRQ